MDLLPLPWKVAMYMASHLAGSGHRDVALCLLISFDLYSRPGEGRRNQLADVILPPALSGFGTPAVLREGLSSSRASPCVRV